VFVVLSILSILLYAPFSILGGLSKKRRRSAERALRIWPLLAVLSLVVFVIIFIVCSDDLIRMGNLTVWSVLICLIAPACRTSARPAPDSM
jgi:peptidoglycan/LPS O-acetylase OafA/YrhL